MTQVNESDATHTPAWATTEPGSIVFIENPTEGYTLEEIYTLFGPGPHVTDEGELIIDEDQLTAALAAEEEQTGGMIALVPSAADIERLVLADGEVEDELHLTLVYLGKAVDITDDQRQMLVDAIVGDVELGLSVVQGEVFSLNVFNPLGEEPCLVLGVGGPGLEQYMMKATEAANTVGIDTSESKKPWIPHITLAYISVPNLAINSLAEDRMGPVTFDRIRVAFGDEVTDIPLA